MSTKKQLVLKASAIFILVLSACTLFSACSGVTQEEYDKLQSRYDELETSYASKTSELENALLEIEDLQNEISAIEETRNTAPLSSATEPIADVNFSEYTLMAVSYNVPLSWVMSKNDNGYTHAGSPSGVLIVQAIDANAFDVSSVGIAPIMEATLKDFESGFENFSLEDSDITLFQGQPSFSCSFSFTSDNAKAVGYNLSFLLDGVVYSFAFGFPEDVPGEIGQYRQDVVDSITINHRASASTEPPATTSTSPEATTPAEQPAEATQVQGTSPAQGGAPSRTVYITETGDKYHGRGCRHLRGNGIETTLSNATANGYTPCGTCGG